MDGPNTVTAMTEMAKFVSSIGVTGILALAVFTLWKDRSARDSAREKKLEDRVEKLEEKTDSHASEYANLAKQVTEAMTKNSETTARNTEVLEMVIDKLKS